MMENNNKKLTIDDLFASDEGNSGNESINEIKKRYSIDDLFGSSAVVETEDLKCSEESINISHDKNEGESSLNNQFLETSKQIEETSEEEFNPLLNNELEEIEKEKRLNKIRVSIAIIVLLFIVVLTILFFMIK